MKNVAGLLTAVAVALVLTGCSNPAAPTGNYGSVSGKIVNAQGQPVAGAQIVIDYVEKFTSAADGTYTAPTVPADPNGSNVHIVVTANGYATQTRDVQVTVGKNTVADFSLTPG